MAEYFERKIRFRQPHLPLLRNSVNKKNRFRYRFQQLPITEKIGFGIEQVIDSERKNFPCLTPPKPYLNEPTAQPATRLRTRMLLIKYNL